MTTTLKHKATRISADKNGNPYFVYRIQGGVWINYVKEYDAYYISIPNSIATAIKEQMTETFKDKPFLKRELDGINDKPLEKNGKVYSDTSFAVKVYELKEKLGEQSSYLVDVAINFCEYTFGNKNGVAKRLLQFVKSEKQTDYLGQDDFFDDVKADVPSASVAEEENPLPF